MKKSTLLIAALAFGATAAFAQDLTSKKGETFLPESGDWSIGIDATPVLNYVGNFIGGNGLNVAPTWNFLNANQTIIGKMYSSETMAYRGIVRIGFSSTKRVEQVNDDANTTVPTFPAVNPTVEDEMKMSTHFIGLGAGMEWRRGKTRLQGFYGGDAMIWLTGGDKTSYTYANAFSSTNPNPSTTDFGTGNTTPGAGIVYGGRQIEGKTGSTFGIGVRGFIGAEYFIIPKLSIGAEFGWGIGFTTTGEATQTWEAAGPSNAGGQTEYTTSGKSSSLMLDTDRNAFGTGNGSLRLNFHF